MEEMGNGAGRRTDRKGRVKSSSRFLPLIMPWTESPTRAPVSVSAIEYCGGSPTKHIGENGAGRSSWSERCGRLVCGRYISRCSSGGAPLGSSPTAIHSGQHASEMPQLLPLSTNVPPTQHLSPLLSTLFPTQNIPIRTSHSHSLLI